MSLSRTVLLALALLVMTNVASAAPAPGVQPGLSAPADIDAPHEGRRRSVPDDSI